MNLGGFILIPRGVIPGGLVFGVARGTASLASVGWTEGRDLAEIT